MSRKGANHLCPIRPCNTLARFGRCFDHGEGDEGLAIIQGAIQAGHVPLLVKNPLEDGSDLRQLPRTRQCQQTDRHALREGITRRSRCPNKPHATRQRISQNPGERDTHEIPLIPLSPLSPRTTCITPSWADSLLVRVKASQSMVSREGLGICGCGRNVCHDGQPSPRVTERGRFFRGAPPAPPAVARFFVH